MMTTVADMEARVEALRASGFDPDSPEAFSEFSAALQGLTSGASAPKVESQ